MKIVVFVMNPDKNFERRAVAEINPFELNNIKSDKKCSLLDKTNVVDFENLENIKIDNMDNLDENI